MATNQPRVVALRYMTRFSCLGGACEDTCCQDWNVTIDEAHFVRLSALLKGPVHSATFELRPAAERTPFAFATIRMRPDTHRCPLLDDDGGCGIHRRLGEPELPDVCSFYPRYVSDIGGRLELAGSLSCPEIVRQALLTDDGLDRVEAPVEVLGRAPVVERPPPNEAALVDELRGHALMLLHRKGEPLATRMRFIGWLAESADAVLWDAVDTADARDRSPRASSEALSGELAKGLAKELAQELAQELEAAVEEDVLETVAEELAAELAPPAVFAIPVMQLLDLRAIAAGSPRAGLKDDLDAVLAVAVGLGLLLPTSEGHALPDDFKDRYLRYVATLSPVTTGLVETWLSRYAENYLCKEPPLRTRSVYAWVRALAIRLATLRLLVILHPDVTGSGPGAANTSAARCFVRLVYRTARILDHDLAASAHVAREPERLLPSLVELSALLSLV